MQEIAGQRIVSYSGAGNRFALVDALDGPAPVDPIALARILCDPEVEPGRDFVPDGLLLLLPAEGGGDLRMVIHNRDGSRAAACGNGLRCLAHHALERGHVAGPAFTVETDAGPRRVRATPEGVAVDLGPARIVALAEHLEVGAEAQGFGNLQATLVDVGVPHCVLFREQLRDDEVLALGPALERHPRFEQGTNVDFVERRDSRLRARVWERGVGETEACGTGAAAICAAVVARHGLDLPLTVRMPGGELTIEGDPERELWLSGPVERR